MADSEEEEEHWPPWLDRIVREDAGIDDDVEVLEEGGTQERRPGLTACKAIRLPEPMHAARGNKAGQCRMVTIRKDSTVLIASGPDEPPYIGLVEQIWRKSDAGTVVNGKRVYKSADFGVECYWFYRPHEVPTTAWRASSRVQPVPGIARYRYDMKGARQGPEAFSERQLLFSSHHTLHDYPDAEASPEFGPGILAFEGFLQECKVHWPSPKDGSPQAYSIHAGKLVRTHAPGFEVHGFLWCNLKRKVMFADKWKEVHALDSDWGDPATKAIVQRMQERYAKGAAKELQAANQRVLDKYAAAARGGKQQAVASNDGRGPAAAAAAVADDAVGPRAGRKGSGSSSAAAAAAAGGLGSGSTPLSPRLPGLEDVPAVSPGPGLAAAGGLRDMSDDDD